MNKFDFTPWRKALAVEVNKNKEDNYPYVCKNVSSSEGIELINSEENVFYLAPGDHLYATKDLVVESLKAIGGYCSNAHIEGNEVVVEAVAWNMIDKLL